MAHQQVYQAYPQNKGTLIPGQTISVNNYTVQVERYLSQGGFAHVYLVRTPQPVYNTTHHVLKRIAVANEAMLTDVKKEVDIMRLLKGHPNIVHLIDAAWHKLPNNTFEVFILMEFCPGGGIIDMMNRRLRERLTEAEILQIFVDVCEGVAYMHNSRPPLLHRDLKVENILQSSPTSFKLCDFGSATTVSHPPTNMQEIRAVEADLNRHTTLQYRAPEMVDVYAKRPVNEKSDVWALGVLLYKLCYYTTPFEEHGPLAILNVQYRIPPYPVYSQDMNTLIASMLREHGAQRPTAFELLNHVHRLRGTRSKFTYIVPVPQPLVSPSQGHIKQLPPSSPNPLEGLVTYGAPVMKPPTPNTAIANQGIQARDRVLEAIAPMRRGRPSASREAQQTTSRPSSPQKADQSRYSNQGDARQQTHNDFTVEQEMAWKAAMEKSAAQGKSSGGEDVAWNVENSYQDVRKAPTERPTGFGDDFAEKLWSASDPNLHAPTQPRLTPSPNRVAMSVERTAEPPATSLVFTGPSRVRPKQDRLLLAKDVKDKDAFEGLGLMGNVQKSAPTLGEARKLRTGLAMISTPASSHTQSDFFRDVDNKAKASSQRPTPSPQSAPRYLSTTPLIPQSTSPVPTTGSTNNPSMRSPLSTSRLGPASASSPEGGTIESRFPSLEELDAQFSPHALYPSAVNEASARFTSQQPKQTSNRSQYVPRTSNVGGSETGGNYLKPSLASGAPYSTDGTRSEQVTGIAMRDVKENKRFPNGNAGPSWELPASESDYGTENSLSSGRDRVLQPKPLVVRKRSSMAMKLPHTSSDGKDPESFENQTNSRTSMGNLPAPTLPARSRGNTSSRDWLTGDDHEEIQAHATPDIPIMRNSPSKRASFIEKSDARIISGSVAQHVDAPEPDLDTLPSAELSPTVSKFRRTFPSVETFGTERPQQSTSAKVAGSSGPMKKEAEPDSSSADEGPEDPSISSAPQMRQNKPRGRQSSVHDLVYQYGGGLVPNDSEKEKEKGKGKEREKEMTRERPSTQYNVGPSDYTPSISRPSMPELAPPISQAAKQKTPSPTATSFKPSFVTQSKPNSSSGRPQPPPLTAKPIIAPKSNNNDIKTSASSRARPQSMFIFPSKSADTSSTPTTNNLAPPPDSRPRATRRTSISDMVQLYETIGSIGTTPGSTPPLAPTAVHKSLATKGNPTEINRQPKSVLTSTKSMKNTASSDTARNSSFALRAQTPSKEAIRQEDDSSRSPAKVHRKLTSDRMTQEFSQTADETTPRAKRISGKGPSTGSSISRTETPTTRSKKPSTSHNVFIPKGSPRKNPISLAEDVTMPNAEESQSSSPERPYQGVGKLIDQWQKKSAEADQSRPVPPGKRGELHNKRAGIVHVDDR